MYDAGWLAGLLAGRLARAQTVRMDETPNVEPVAPDDSPELQVPESPGGLVMDVVTGVIADQVAGPMVNDAARIVVDKIRDIVTGNGAEAADAAAPDDGGFLDS